MPHSKPFHRNFRPFVPGHPASSVYSSHFNYIRDKDYAVCPEHYVRAFLLLQNDLQTVLEFIEPSDANLEANVYSYRIHALFMRTCIELEANFKAILKENIFNPKDRTGRPIPEERWNIHHYRKINKTHHLDALKVHIPIWEGSRGLFVPFMEWAGSRELSWYQAYNKSKHDRRLAFQDANFSNLLHAMAALVAVLASQFLREDFSPGFRAFEVRNECYHYAPAIGGFFHLEFPDNWTDDELYDFDWDALKTHSGRFERIDYDAI